MTPGSPALALAVDLGGTKVEAALVDGDGDIVEGSRHRAATGSGSDHASLDAALAEVISGALAVGSPYAAGVGAAGPVDLALGTTSPINMAGAAGYPIVARVRAHAGLADVTLRLDGTCIALAEAWRGAASGSPDAIVFVVSTGVGGGIFSGGRLLSGASGNAGHLGQLIIANDTDSLSAMTVEGRASGPATVAWARSRGFAGNDGEALSRADDPLARSAIERSANAVGVGVANVATLLDLPLAVIGGGFSGVAEDYPSLVQDAARAHALNAYARRLRVVRAALGDEAPLIGAGALVHRRELL